MNEEERNDSQQIEKVVLPMDDPVFIRAFKEFEEKPPIDINDIIKQKNAKISALEQKGQDFFLIGDYESALQEYNKILFFNPKMERIYAKRGEIYLKLCDFSSAICNFKRALQLVKSNEDWTQQLSQLFFLKGLSMIDAGYCSDALKFIKNLKLKDFKFTYLRALAYVRAGNKELALEELDSCLKMDHFNVEALVLKGKLLWSLDKTEEGNEQFWVAHSLEPNHSEVIEFLSIIRPKAEEAYERARKEYMEGNDTGALMWIRKGLDVFHDMSKLLLLRASIMRKRKSFENAIDDLELASKFMEAEHIDKEVKIQIGLTYNDMGKLLFSKGKHDGAISVFNESIKYLPQDPGIHINRGDAYREEKKFNLALADYHYAMDLGGEKDMVKMRLALTHYSLGARCFNRKDYEGSIIEFSSAIEFNQNVAEFYVQRARCYLATSVIHKAYVDLQEALKIDPAHGLANSYMQNFKTD